MRLRHRDLTPPQGWQFIQQVTGLVIKADTLDNLVLQVIRHREFQNSEYGHTFETKPERVAIEVERTIAATVRPDHRMP